MKKGSGEYEVGKNRPPLEKRFAKGKSGNPGGRPKGSRNLNTEWREELSEPVLIREKDGARKVSKTRAIIKRTVNSALQGVERATDRAMKAAERLEEAKPIASHEEAQQDREILAEYTARLRDIIRKEEGLL